MKLANLRISTRFMVLIGIFVLGSVVYGAWSFMTLNELKVNGPLYHRIVQSKDLIADILPPPEYILESYLVSMQLAAASDKPAQEKLIARLAALKGEYDTRHDYWTKEKLEDPLGEVLLNQAHGPARTFYALAEKELIPAVRNQDKDGASAAMARMETAYEAHRKAIDQVVQMSNQRCEADEARAKASIAAATWELLLTLALSLGIGVTVAIMITRSISRPLKEAVSIAQVVAAGDLTTIIEVRSTDETGQLMQALKDMNDSLVRIVGQVRIGTDTIADASSQVAAGNLDLSSRTEQQASSLEETASAMEELTSTVRSNANNAGEANQLAATASSVAAQGGAVVAQVVATMGSINASSRKIVDIISVIDAIAFQTNILALNAAVEAARAGEQGRGFAVVASEVRSLAQRSASAAKEIKTLIDTSVEQVDAGSRLVGQAGSTMNDVVASVQRVGAIIADIASASREQTIGIEHIGQAIAQMDQVTQQNAALVEQAAAAADSMQQQAAELSHVVSVFKLARDTDAPAALPAPRRAALSLVGKRA
ncbi:methyl-accepting chemotaxis protein [Oxalobacteraceae bacterium GrIS 1.11]